MGVSPTGRRVTVQHLHVYRMNAGEITERRAVRDDLGIMQQLGLTATGTTPAEDISRLHVGRSPTAG